MERIVIAQPVVTDVTLSPLTESFWFDYGGCGTNEQWWNELQGAYTPDHATNPLLIIPRMSVFDPDTEQVFNNPTWYRIDYFLQDANGEFTEQIVTGEDYTIRGDWTLLVSKNLVSGENGVPILVIATYIDPRDSSVVGTVSRQMSLILHEDASTHMPTISIENEKMMHFDPMGVNLVANPTASRRTFKAKVRLGEVDVTSQSTIHWYACDAAHSTPVLLDARTTVGGVSVPVFPGYISGQGTDTLVVDALYSERLLIIAKPVNTSVSPNEDYPTQDYCTLSWEASKVDAFAKSDNGQRIDELTKENDFNVIVNVKREDKTTETISDAEKKANLLFNWKCRAADSGNVVDKGFGLNVLIDGATLRSNRSHQIKADAFLRGITEMVTCEGNPVTCDGEIVYCRG